MSESLRLTGFEIELLARKREENGTKGPFPSPEELQYVSAMRYAAAAKAAKHGGSGGGFDLDNIKMGMSAEERAKASAAILQAWSNE